MVLPTKNPTKSYWIEAAKSPLRHERTTENLQETTDVVIVGSGYTGAATAYWLDKSTTQYAQQPRMLMLEARDVCGGATGRNGGQLRPHFYSRYSKWSEQVGSAEAMELIEHEVAHLDAFKKLADGEGITDEICLKYGETFDAFMTEEAASRLEEAYEAMRKDHGDDHEVVKACRVIDNAAEAEEFTQMKGALGAVVHPAGQIWPYKFVHALLRLVLARGNLNIQANTPVLDVSLRDDQGYVTVKTDRGTVRARTVVHATNRWASHLLPELENLILPDRGTIAAIKAASGFIKHTGAQHWDAVVNNYHLQLPSPHNVIILGGGRQLLVQKAKECLLSDAEDRQIEGAEDFFRTWPASDLVGWNDDAKSELADVGGCWTGVQSSSIDGFPFVGSVPGRDGQFIAAGFNGHGMPRILLSALHISSLVLDYLKVEHSTPDIGQGLHPLPHAFQITEARLHGLAHRDTQAFVDAYRESCRESSKKPFCQDERFLRRLSQQIHTDGEIRMGIHAECIVS